MLRIANCKTVLVVLLLCLGGVSPTRAEEPKSLSWRVATAMAERLVGHGFRSVHPRVRGRLGLAGQFNDVNGDLWYGDDATYPIPVYTYDRSRRRWARGGSFKAKRRAPRLGFTVRVHDRGREPESLARQAQAQRESSGARQTFDPSSGIRRQQERRTTERRFERVRRAGALIERLVKISTPHSDAVARVGRKAFSAPVAPLGPEEVRVVIAYPFESRSKGRPSAQTLVVTLRLTTGPGLMRPAQYVEASHIEGVALDAIAASLGSEAPTPSPEPGDDEPADPPAADPDPDPPEPKVDVPPTPDGIDDAAVPLKLRQGGVYGRAARLLGNLVDVQRAQAATRVILRAGVVALEDQRTLLSDVRRVAQVLGPRHPEAAFYRKWLVEIHDRIVELEAERRGLIDDMQLRFDELREQAVSIPDARANDPAFTRRLASLRGELATRKELAMAELFLAAGDHRALASRLRPLLADTKTAEAAYELKALSLVDQGKPAAALEAVHAGLGRFKRNETLAQLKRGLEVAFLRALASKATDHRAKLNAAWETHMQGAGDGQLWTAVFGGLKRVWQDKTGKAARLEALHGSEVDRLAMTHNGIELLMRLRRSGLTFDEIRGFGPAAIQRTLGEIAPDMAAPSQRQLEAMELSLDVAFESEDVKRLVDGDRAFDLDVGAGVFSSPEAFKETWMEWGLDLVSVKNVAVMFGPYARMAGTGVLGRFARALGGMEASPIALEAAKRAPTVQEWTFARPALTRVGGWLAKSRAGQVLREGGHVLRALRYDTPLPVRMGTAAAGFASQIGAGWMLWEGLGEVGEQLGGELGRAAGQLAASVIGVPGSGSTAQLQARWERSLQASQTARRLWDRKNAVLKTLRGPILRSVAANPVGPAPTVRVLEQAVERAERLARTTRTEAARTGSRLLMHAAEEAEALAATARAGLNGNPQRAAAAGGISQRLAGEADDLARTLTREIEQLAGAPPTSRRNPAHTVRRPRAPGAAPAMEDAAAGVASGPSPPGSAPKGTVTAPPTPAAPTALPTGDVEKFAKRALHEGRFEEAAALLRAASRNPHTPIEVRDRLAAATKDALAAARTSRSLAKWRARPGTQASARIADEARQAFSASEKQVLAKATEASTRPLAGAGGARLIEDAGGRPLAVWKPAGREGVLGLNEEGQLISEVLMSRLARALGLRVPHVEPMVLDGELGVVSKWIPHTKDLAELAPGARAAFKEQVASFRALQVVMGNYDLHMGNFKVDRAGNIWAIDAGQAVLTTPTKAAADFASRWGVGRGSLKGGNEVLDWTRLMRDLYSDLGAAGAGSGTDKPALREFEKLLRLQDMTKTAGKLRDLSKRALAREIRDVMKSTVQSRQHGQAIYRTLLARRDAIERLLAERWH